MIIPSETIIMNFQELIEGFFSNPNFILVLEKLDLIATPVDATQDINAQVNELLNLRIEFMLYIMIFISVLLLFLLIRTMRS